MSEVENLKAAMEISIHWQFDCCPYENSWQIWTLKDQYNPQGFRDHDANSTTKVSIGESSYYRQGNNYRYLSTSNDGMTERVIIESKTYIDAKPYTSIDETILLNSQMPLTLTVYDSNNDGFEDSQLYYYQVIKTIYDYPTDNQNIDNESDKLEYEWTETKAIIATVHGKFGHKDHILQRKDKMFEPETSEIIETTIVDTSYRNETNGIHHIIMYGLMLIALFTVAVIVGVNILISIEMYKKRQKGTSVEALDEENLSFLQSSKLQEDERIGDSGSDIVSTIYGDANDDHHVVIPHYVNVDDGELCFNNKAYTE
jgi:hypothetical protein